MRGYCATRSALLRGHLRRDRSDHRARATPLASRRLTSQPVHAGAAKPDVIARPKCDGLPVLVAARTRHSLLSRGLTHWQVLAAALGMLVAAVDDHATVDEAAAVGTGDLHQQRL